MAKVVGECSRRDFLKTGTVVGVSLMAMGSLVGCASQKNEEPKSESDSSAATDQAEGEEASAVQTDTIYIVDVLHCKPGDGKALYDHYMSKYVPGAEQRGMMLVGASVNPPIWLDDDVANNTLEFVWSVPGMMGWAGMVGVSRYDPVVSQELIDFWYDIDDRVESRTRTLSAPDTDVESLTTLERLNPGV